MQQPSEMCCRCDTPLTVDNWDRSWNVRICNKCKNKWVIESMQNDDELVLPAVEDTPYAQNHPERMRIANRDMKYKVLTGSCVRCGKTSNDTIRHHLWYPVGAYDPNSVIELCPMCHGKIHSDFGSMPIVY